MQVSENRIGEGGEGAFVMKRKIETGFTNYIHVTSH